MVKIKSFTYAGELQLITGQLDLGSYDIANATDALDRVPLLSRALSIRSGALLSVPRYLERGDDTLADGWPPASEFERLEWDYLMEGAAYAHIAMERRLPVVRRINPLSMRVGIASDGSIRFRQVDARGRTLREWGDDEIAYLHDYTVRDDLRPTSSAAQRALNALRLWYYATVYARQFFEQGTINPTIIGVDGMGTKGRETLQRWWKRLASGLRRAWSAVAVSGSVSVATLGQPVDKLALPDLDERARRSVGDAFGIPAEMLDKAANYATATEKRRSFYSETVIPQALRWESAFNAVLERRGIRLRFAPQEMDIFQEDEERRASAFATYVRAGLDRSIVGRMLGLELPDGMEWADLDAPPVPAASSTVEPQADEGDDAKRLALSDLSRWRRKALKRMKARGRGDAPFQSDTIPPVLMGALRGALAEAETPDEVRAAFAQAEEALRG